MPLALIIDAMVWQGKGFIKVCKTYAVVLAELIKRNVHITYIYALKFSFYVIRASDSIDFSARYDMIQMGKNCMLEEVEGCREVQIN